MYWQTAVLYSGAGFIQLFLVLSTGILIIHLLKIKVQGMFKMLFYALCTGMYAWILLSALFFTQGKTVLAGTLPLIIAILWQYRLNKPTAEQKQTYSPLRIFQYILTGAEIWLWTSFLNLYLVSIDGNYLYLPHFDTLHSIEISQYVQKTGIETYYYWQSSTYTFPYHYAEIWLHAGIQALWHGQKTWTWQNMLVPLLQTTLITGLLAMVEQYNKKVTFYWILAACGFILFQGWLNISLPHFDPHFDFTRYISMTGATKYLVIGILCLLYELSQPSLKMLFLLLLPLFSILTLPVVLVFAGIVGIKKRQNSILLATLLLISWLTAFYLITGNASPNTISLNAVFPVFDLQFLKMQVYFIAVSLVFYLPTFLWLKEKKEVRNMGIVFAVSYVCFLMVYKWYDSYQLLTLFWIPFVWVYSWKVVIRNTQKYTRVIVLGVMLFSIVQTFLYKRDFQRTAINNAWVNEIYAFLAKENLLQQGAALWYYDVKQSHIFCWQNKDSKITSLLAKPVPVDGITQKSASDTLTAYMMQKSLLFQPQNTPDLEKQIIDFCKQNHLRFLIYPSNTLVFDAHKKEIVHHFESKKDALSCVVFK